MNILTEEELKEIEDLYNRLFPRLNTEFPNVVKLINSHRLLLSANAELSFKNNKYKQALIQIYGVEMDSAEFEREVMFNIARDILKEELK